MWQVGLDTMLTEDQIVCQKKMKYMLFFHGFFLLFFFQIFYNLREVCRIFCPIDQDVLLKHVFEGKLLRWFSFPGVLSSMKIGDRKFPLRLQGVF